MAKIFKKQINKTGKGKKIVMEKKNKDPVQKGRKEEKNRKNTQNYPVF